ncbi:hypothetical protein NUW58_g3437 [Xylaria curta]|uniref:Uncharacterized protein n=1 Tax=Xylaria curta TaxID=42375 RepID=A0ACC1PDB5_9PEZI|nr:hypothetical protein NUW58_g3437 [Xylaria curta]
MPTFDISNLLLDLDAEGAKGVRTFDPRLDGMPEPRSALRKRELQPIKKRVADFEKRYQEYQSSLKSISDDTFHPLRINEFDLFAAALLDAPDGHAISTFSKFNAKKPPSHARILDSVLDSNGIPHTVRNNTSDTIAYMLFRHRLLCRSQSTGFNDEGLFSAALSRCASFAEVDRLVTRITRTSEGCQILSRLSDELYTSLTIVPDAEPIQLLSLLNNLLLNFDRWGLHMSTELYELGIWTSLQRQAIIAAQQYLERRLELGHLDDKFIESLLENLLRNSISSTPFTSHEFQSNVPARLGTVFSLLTGYEPGKDQPTASLRSLVDRERSTAFNLYIGCLARLGAFRTIWHEWHTMDSGSQGLNIDRWQDSAFTGNSSLVTAILIALAENPSVKDLARSPAFAVATGKFQEDCQLDMITISQSAKILALPEKRLINFGFTPTHARQREQLYEIFKKKNIQEALPALQAFLNQTSSFS